MEEITTYKGVVPEKKLLFLESIRGIAALIVVFDHFAVAFLPAAILGTSQPTHSSLDHWFFTTPSSILFAGNFSVCVFFVLSGFVLTKGYFTHFKRGSLMNGALRRYLRLMVPVSVSILAGWALLKLGLFYNDQAAIVTGSSWLGAFFNFPAHLLNAIREALYGTFFQGDTTYNPILWTMQIEFFGSFLVFAAASLFGTLQRRWLIYLLLGLIFFQTYYLGFVAGMALADLSSRRPNFNFNGWLASVLIVGGLLLGSFHEVLSTGSLADLAKLGWINLNPLQVLTFWHTVGAILVVGTVIFWERAQKPLSAKPLVALGRVSFSVYLTHFLILCSFSSYLFVSLVHLGYLQAFGITFLISFILIILVSDVYVRLIDGPAIRLSRQFGGWVQGRL